MEDVTDIGFRLLCKKFGADMVYTEFVSSDALVRNVERTLQKINICEEERPLAIQIYGRDPGAMAEAAQICEESDPDIIDINFGCPVKKVAGKGAGAGMLRAPELMLEITRKVVDAVKKTGNRKNSFGMGRKFQNYCNIGRTITRLRHSRVNYSWSYAVANV